MEVKGIPHGKQKILFISLIITLIGVCLTLDSHLFIKILGLGLFTYGFFGGIRLQAAGSVNVHYKTKHKPPHYIYLAQV